jgi:hypothetical protein
MSNIPDHPDIVWCERTGYPQWAQPTSSYCEECGKCLDDEDEYEDSLHDCLCEDCLLSLHKKWW